jgi:hypothetical protein
MKGFGDWLSESKLGLTDIIDLRKRSAAMQWNSKSDKIGDYVTAVQNSSGLCVGTKNETLACLYRLWPLYESQEVRDGRGTAVTGWIVTVVALLLLGLIGYLVIKADPFSSTHPQDPTRGILAFLFGLTTVGVIVIVVVAVLFESRETTLEERFQRGKDILTILIGLLGAILGYYFGQQSVQQERRPAVQADGRTTVQPDAKASNQVETTTTPTPRTP